MSVKGGATCSYKVNKEGQECSFTISVALIRFVVSALFLTFIALFSLTVFYGATGLNTMMNVGLVQAMLLLTLWGSLDET